MSEPCWIVDLGRRGFEDTLALQRRVVAARQSGLVPDALLFVEHPPVYTIGRGGRDGRGGGREHLLVDARELEASGVSVVETDRGGDITFHGPGQLVGYPILNLKSWTPDVHAYLRALETVLIDAVRDFGIDAGREEGLTGVWHRSGKIAAMGVRVSRWVTSHGFALNVSVDLEYFNHIVPCGIVGRAVSSMESILKAPVARDHVMSAVTRAFARTFDRNVLGSRQADLEVCTR